MQLIEYTRTLYYFNRTPHTFTCSNNCIGTSSVVIIVIGRLDLFNFSCNIVYTYEPIHKLLFNQLKSPTSTNAKCDAVAHGEYYILIYYA